MAPVIITPLPTHKPVDLLHWSVEEQKNQWPFNYQLIENNQKGNKLFFVEPKPGFDFFLETHWLLLLPDKLKKKERRFFCLFFFTHIPTPVKI